MQKFEQVKSVADISGILFANMTPGTISNHAMTADEYHNEVAAGTLYFYNWDGGLLFLRKRKRCNQLTYCLNDLHILPDITIPNSTFVDITSRPGAEDKAQQAVEYWTSLGFTFSANHIRLTKSPTLLHSTPIRCHPKKTDYAECEELLEACFGKNAGYLPTQWEFENDVENGMALRLFDIMGGICAFLRGVQHNNAVEIRLLAVREDRRGRGNARHIMSIFLGAHTDKKIIVWVDNNNEAALKLYKSVGFDNDGWRSTMLTNNTLKE